MEVYQDDLDLENAEADPIAAAGGPVSRFPSRHPGGGLRILLPYTGRWRIGRIGHFLPLVSLSP